MFYLYIISLIAI